ncbi:MAG: Fermentation-respiration switch protein FrsA, has esterase activity, DUF1100 family [Chloroflexi bacterium AL-W]|nr:Fermentation-respiration switch protein FrsA, has esterase activity, DUF1100 family [Chloroflexi bacterium AL-N1]NOK69903.1 Fermentation-respiration switch protein FrsA, has esterase activity, DUF1100 family [Chloroflexi bacterium AL-N10]NOK73801.1 Fermentation-respiration switch protein FrsA, has esterase activity, DUF1100 family [Chloroflexi bacterium AL-N5]NOK85436.1 Fermentation-respiration switch protein FrsA, has esterase activity, DUF1100 family [Chloroflexi bacterium AL-W]NOK91636.1 
MVYARVIEPESYTGAIPTFIYGSGLGMPYDFIPYWPEEDYMTWPLARRGCRTILMSRHGMTEAHHLALSQANTIW